jgi:dCMP deaminase
METAHVISHRGSCERSQVGSIISKDSRIVSTGYVGSPAGSAHCSEVGCEIGNHGGCIRTVHAEANAIAFAARAGVGTEGCVLYTTLAPCRECAKLIVNAGIIRVVYHHSYRDPSGLKLLEDASIQVDNFVDVSKVDHG